LLLFYLNLKKFINIRLFKFFIKTSKWGNVIAKIVIIINLHKGFFKNSDQKAEVYVENLNIINSIAKPEVSNIASQVK
jgi:hypothetical protein